MITAQIMGLETEYALFTKGAKPADAHDLFTGWEPAFTTPWDYGSERPWLDARGFVPSGATIESQMPLQLLATGHVPTEPPLVEGLNRYDIQIETEVVPGFMLPNGARFYLDHLHPEWSTPECADPLQAVLYDRAGEMWLGELITRLNADRDEPDHFTLFKNNVDARGNSYGCHENYLVDTQTYRNMFGRQMHRLYTVLIPFLVSRQVLCGTGQVAEVNGEWGFQISQRGEFFAETLGLQTTHDRPIINTRDEPHADPARFRRLHVIVGDANRAEFSTYIKVGTLALLLEALAARSAGPSGLNVALVDPAVAMQQVTRDPTCRVSVQLDDGRAFTAIDLQRSCAELVGRYLENHPEPGYRTAVFENWIAVLDQLASDPAALADRVDWVIKYQLLQNQMSKNGWDWNDYRVRELDLKYHQIDSQRNLFKTLTESGLVATLFDEATVRTATTTPPVNTRAHLRLQCLDRFRDDIQAISWGSVVFQGQANRVWRWHWDDPRDNGQARLAPFWKQATDLESLVRLLFLSAEQQTKG